MRPYEKLTHLGRQRRRRSIAQSVLRAYGLGNARLKFIRYSGNTVYRVYSQMSSAQVDSALFYEDQFALRIHQPGYQSDDAITSELTWLAALRAEHLPVMEPVRTQQGKLSVEVEVPGVPGKSRCSLLRWMKGRMLSPQHIRPRHLKALGRLMAQLHLQASRWQFPPGFSRPRYDWDGLYGSCPLLSVPPNVVREHIPRVYFKSFEVVTGQLRQVMAELGDGPDAFGIIHADLSVGTNIFFSGGQASAIDFDDCALGYWMFDLGVALSEWREARNWLQVRDAVLAGYSEIRSLPEAQLKYLDLFIAAWHAFEVYWASGCAHLFPDDQQGYIQWAERAAKQMVNTLDHCQ